MNKFTTLMTLAATTAAGVALADLTPFDSLELSQAATFAKTEPSTLDGDLSSAKAALVVGPDDATALKDVEKFTVVFNVGFVEWAELQGVKPKDAKIGFAFTGTSTAAYFNGTTWTQVQVSEVAEEDEKTLLIELDRRDATKKARFSFVETVEGVETKTVVKDWVAVADVVSNTVAIYGSGTIVSVHGATYTIAAEIVVVDPEGTGEVNIDFTPTQMTDLATKFGCDPSDVPAKLTAEATKGANGNTALVNYVLFGEVGTTVDKTLVVKGNPTGGDASNVAISIPNLNPQTVTGAAVSFQLQGRATADAEWHNVGAANTTGAFSFPANTTDRYFKVVTTITYGTAQ